MEEEERLQKKINIPSNKFMETKYFLRFFISVEGRYNNFCIT